MEPWQVAACALRAEIYGSRVNEELVGRALRGRRDHVVSATEFVLVTHSGDGVWNRDSSRAEIRTAAECSLKWLGTDRIDLYRQYRGESGTPIEVTAVIRSWG